MVKFQIRKVQENIFNKNHQTKRNMPYDSKILRAIKKGIKNKQVAPIKRFSFGDIARFYEGLTKI